MENLKLNYVQLVQYKKELEERNAKALDYIAKCNRKETETNEMADSLVGGLLCVAIGVVTYLLVYNGIIL